MFKAKVYVTLKESVLDPKGKAVMNTLHNLGYKTITDTRISKYIEMIVDETDERKASGIINEICDKVLSNPNVETYRFELEKNHE